jgi:uncharacterized OB-fold protein
MEAIISAAARFLERRPGGDDAPTAGPDVADGGVLRFQRCDRCRFTRYPVARSCPECLSVGSTWVQDPGEGSVWSFAVYQRAFDPAFAEAVPYNVALVELDTGPRLVSNVIGLEPDQLRVGLRVRAVLKEVIPGRFLVYFVPDDKNHRNHQDRPEESS